MGVLKGWDCEEVFNIVQDTMNATYDFSAGRESWTEKQEPHFVPVVESLAPMVKGQHFVRELAHESMTPETVTKWPQLLDAEWKGVP